MHQKIQASIRKWTQHERFVHLNIPTYHNLIQGTDSDWWSSRLTRFPEGEGLEPCNVLISERILPFLREVPERLIDLYCPPQIQDLIKASKSDTACLVRPYLGRLHQGSRSDETERPRLQYFKLRNKPLHLNQLRDIGCPAEEYARVMADALAILYWDAKVDANDVEFVLAPAGSHAGITETWHNDVLGEHTMWILDFDLVRGVTMDEEGVEKCVDAFWRNDSYYPRPGGGGDQEVVWDVFKQRFLESSEVVLGKSALPELLMRRLEEEGAERRQRVRALNEG